MKTHSRNNNNNNNQQTNQFQSTRGASRSLLPNLIRSPILSVQKPSFIQTRTTKTSSNPGIIELGTPQVNSVKAEVAKLLKEEVEEKEEEYFQETRKNISKYNKWFQSVGFSSSYEDRALVLRREIQGNHFTASFYFEEQDEKTTQDEEEHDDDDEEQQDEEDEEEEEEEESPHVVNVDIKIKTESNKSTYLMVEGFIKDGQIVMTNIRIEDQLDDDELLERDDPNSDSSIPLANISQELQNKLYDFIELFGLDTDLLETATDYLSQEESQTFFQNLKKLSSFFSNK